MEEKSWRGGGEGEIVQRSFEGPVRFREPRAEGDQFCCRYKTTSADPGLYRLWCLEAVETSLRTSQGSYPLSTHELFNWFEPLRIVA